MNDFLHRLKTLLDQVKEANNLARLCFEDQPWDVSDDSDLHSTNSIPAGEVAHIYQRRYELMKQKGPKVEGYEDLLTELAACPNDGISIHGLCGQRECYIVFTNDSMTRLVGILAVGRNRKNAD